MKTCRGTAERNGAIWRMRTALMAWGLVLTAAPSLTAAPIVTIIDDDAGSVKAVAAVKEVADRCGIKVTFAAYAVHLESNPKIAATLEEYVAEGHEVASHSLTHRPAIWKAGSATDIRAIEYEIVEAKERFVRLGLNPETFVYPFGNFPREVRAKIFDIVGMHYPVAFNARGDINLPGKMYPLYISRHPLRKHDSMLMTKRLVDEAIAADRAWIVILTHSAKADFSAEMLEETIRYAQKSGAVFLPASAAWRQVRTWPMMEEDDISDYTLLDDLLNAAYFHLPLLSGAVAAVMLLGGSLFFCLRRRLAKIRKPEGDGP